VRASLLEIQRLAERVVEAVLQQGYVKAKVDKSILARKAAELIQQNLEQEAELEAEAERMAEQHMRGAAGAGMDQRRVIELIKKKLAEEKGFTL